LENIIKEAVQFRKNEAFSEDFEVKILIFDEKIVCDFRRREQVKKEVKLKI